MEEIYSIEHTILFNLIIKGYIHNNFDSSKRIPKDIIKIIYNFGWLPLPLKQWNELDVVFWLSRIKLNGENVNNSLKNSMIANGCDGELMI